MSTRTTELVTCGITNIPLTKPARIFFTPETKDKESVNMIRDIYNSNQIEFSENELFSTGITRFISVTEVMSDKLKPIWRNFKSLHPKFDSKWRYLLWELDDFEQKNFNSVLDVYNYLELPIYIHRTLRGWHFISVKPIQLRQWKLASEQIQFTNPTFPRITLRINPNKYIDEEKVFSDGFIISKKYHSDTNEIRNWIQSKNYDKIGQKYQLVYYHFEGKEHDRFI